MTTWMVTFLFIFSPCKNRVFKKRLIYSCSAFCNGTAISQYYEVNPGIRLKKKRSVTFIQIINKKGPIKFPKIVRPI